MDGSQNTTQPSPELKKSFERIRQMFAQAYLPWSRRDDEKLLRLHDQFMEKKNEPYRHFLVRMGRQFGRESGAIDSRIRKLSQNPPPRQKPAAQTARRSSPPVKDFSDNPQAQEILRLMEQTNKNLFITGLAGTGKSSLLEHFRQTTKKKVVVLAPTGVAAVNVGGQTIHSFCRFAPDIIMQKVKKQGKHSAVKKLLKHLDTIIIDEVSMVRADLMDCMEKFLCLNGRNPKMPFGGYQVILFGDLYQLPPVDKDFQEESALFKDYESPYFFHSHSYQEGGFKLMTLEKVYRQSDPVFLDILNAVRHNRISTDQLTLLNSRLLQDRTQLRDNSDGVFLTTVNVRASEINRYFLNRLPGESRHYESVATGKFQEQHHPTDMVIEIKPGARVMLLNNDRERRWVNGSIGTVEKVHKAESPNEPDALIVKLNSGRTVTVLPYTWERTKYTYDEANDAIIADPIGTFTQYPVRLAWALTIHKSQGQTFDRIYVDLSRGTFAHGQLYVALSRCRKLQGVFLNRCVKAEDIKLDSRVVDFFSDLTNA